MQDQTVRTSQCDVRPPDDLATLVSRYAELKKAVFRRDGTLMDLDVSNVKSMKSQLAGPMEALGSNLSSRAFSAAASDFLFRKCLPSPPGDPIPGYLQKLTRESLVTEGFAQLAAETIPVLFRKGWDREWLSYVKQGVVSANSCTEAGRSAGGARGIWTETVGRDSWFRMLSTGEGLKEFDNKRRVLVLEDGGKKRIVTIASYGQAILGPLHQMIYDQLVRSGAILRGEATASTMSGMARTHAEKEDVFVSGDYESATDNIEVANTQLLLGEIRKQSRFVPDKLWDIAIGSMVGLVEADGETRAQCNGQLMGNLLSFPLLCLTNLLSVIAAFGQERTWDLVRRGLLKINGDDIVFRCKRAEVEVWFEAVAKVGLTLSRGKTLVHKRFFSLNSTFFRADIGRVVLVPVLRSATIIRDLSKDECTFGVMNSRIAAAVKGWNGVAREAIVSFSLRRFMVIWRGRGGLGGYWGSIRANLDTTVKIGALKKVSHNKAILKRELYMSNPVLRATDRPFGFDSQIGIHGAQTSASVDSCWRFIPKTKLLGVEAQIAERQFSNWCIERTWSSTGESSSRKKVKERPYHRWNERLAITPRRGTVSNSAEDTFEKTVGERTEFLVARDANHPSLLKHVRRRDRTSGIGRSIEDVLGELSKMAGLGEGMRMLEERKVWRPVRHESTAVPAAVASRLLLDPMFVGSSEGRSK